MADANRLHQEPANQNKPWVSGFGEPLDDNDLVNRARVAVALEMYPVDTIVPALVRTVNRLEAELERRRRQR